ncbi:MAG: chalcone isomerase family protein [Candidatus Berkiella sp.]
MALLHVCCFAKNYTFKNQEIPSTVVIEETGDVLTLRGVALHKVFFQDTYIGAFYSLNKDLTPQDAINDPGPKRMWLYFLRSVDNLREYWEEGIQLNNPPDLVEREQISISQFFKMIDMPLREGDTLILDFVPNVGTKITIKGNMKGLIKGNEFYNLVLKTWMGRSPPSEKFRKDLFNLS